MIALVASIFIAAQPAIAPPAYAAAQKTTRARRQAPRPVRGKGRPVALPPSAPATAPAQTIQPGDSTPIKPKPVPTIPVPVAADTFLARFNAVFPQATKGDRQ